MSEERDLDQLRQEIGQVDQEIVELMARRLRLAEEVGQWKLKQNLPVKNYQVEKRVIARNRAFAQESGCLPDLAEDVSKLLIEYAVATQDENLSRSKRDPKKEAESILIIGGLGRMGLWLAHFFDSFNHHVRLYDTESIENQSRFERADNFIEASRKATVIVLATPIAKTAEILDALSGVSLQTLIFDICSLKSPLLASIEKARSKKASICSIHPMFGPSIQLLAGQNILICDCGVPEATKRARLLFEDTTANIIEMAVTDHDEYVGNVLGLSHLSNLVFAHALSQSGLDYSALTRIGSTTFNAQKAVSEQVVNENQDLYYEIQAENAVTTRIIERLKLSIEQFDKTIRGRHRDQFKALMEESRRYFEG
ncbi:MAG: prephenate dehydrogenase/arogenate dehydrogenase family protein [Planctomycetota bacterium]|nr:prephenate dehydrogenase/arogenate dehydrogenase family protein [Planctomycetota bacterium]